MLKGISKNSFRKAAWFLAGALAMGVWQNRDMLWQNRPLRARFNAEATAHNRNVPSYIMPSAAKPVTKQDVWAIRIGSRHMAIGGHHLFLEFAPADLMAHPHRSDGNTYQIHGVGMDRKTRDYVHLEFGKFKTYRDYFTSSEALKVIGVNRNFDEGVIGHEPNSYTDIWYGTKDEVLKLYMDAMTLADYLNGRDLDYDILTQNSNSVVRAVLDGLGLPLPDVFDGSIRANLWPGRLWTPAFGHSLLPPEWDRQKIRDTYHYDGLSGAALEKAAVAAAHGELNIWPDPKKHSSAPKPRAGA